MFDGRHVEPLAFSMDNKSIVAQSQCLLFTVIPNEIRDMIYQYAFTDCTSHPPNRNNKFREWDGRQDLPRPSDIAFPFLQSCKMVYLEAYRLPLLLNPLIVYDVHVPTRPSLNNLAPWQFALIQGVDISLQQTSLEYVQLAEYMEMWKAEQRHAGAYVAPRFFHHSHHQATDPLFPFFNFGLLGADTVGNQNPKDGDAVTLTNKMNFYDASEGVLHDESTYLAMVARPITRLTLRLTRRDWWTWGDDPNTTEVTKQLRLDPSFGYNQRLFTPMLELAEQRRAGRHPKYGRNWGAAVCALPDLKTLELVLETWEVKKYQLDTVVECAKTWKFPLRNTRCELLWNETEPANWKREKGDENDFARDFRIKTVGDIEALNNDGYNDYNFDGESDEETEQEGEDEDDDENEDEDSEDSPGEERDSEDNAQPHVEESWDRKCKEFEVRIVRFKRSTIR
jgi:hypothetical protein